MNINLLCTAAENGDIKEIKRLIIKERIGPNDFHTVYGNPPIAFAAQKGHVTAILELITLGAKVNYKAKFKNKETMMNVQLYVKVLYLIHLNGHVSLYPYKA